MPLPPRISYLRTERNEAAVTIDNRPSGSIKRYHRDIWTYDHAGTSFVGPIMELKQAIRRAHSTKTAQPDNRPNSR